MIISIMYQPRLETTSLHQMLELEHINLKLNMNNMAFSEFCHPISDPKDGHHYALTVLSSDSFAWMRKRIILSINDYEKYKFS